MIGWRAERPLRFAAAGAASVIAGLSVYPLLLWAVPAFQTHYLFALAIAQVVSLCFAFAAYKLGVFRTRGNLVREFGAFASFHLVNYAANWIILPILVEIGGVPPVIAQLGFALVSIVTSWFWHSRITFRAADRP